MVKEAKSETMEANSEETTPREKENPDAYWVHLSEAAITYAHLDLGCPKNQRIPASTFVDQSADDICNHFHQIISNWSTLEISELHRIANFVYNQREKIKEKEQERKEMEKERERDRKRRPERREELQVFAAIHHNNGQTPTSLSSLDKDAGSERGKINPQQMPTLPQMRGGRA
ncbi:hypothetical protein L345_11454, partial [Ophiophagus hannah]